MSSSRWVIVLAGGIIVLAALAAYHNCFAVPFIFDDGESITRNPTIRHLWPIWQVLSPPQTKGFTVAGRPLVNLSLAFNYAFGGTAVWGYHAANLLIHILAGLTLFGVVRRTLLQPVLRARFGGSTLPLALAVAVLWTVHPLQTEAVTYVVQRAESLMGLFYLLTMYCFIRGTESQRLTPWLAFSIVTCLLGMASKEVMVSAPLLLLLYDRTFVAGSFQEAWKWRWRLYAGLAGTWLLLGYLVVGTANRGGTAGLGYRVSGWAYALTQCWAIVHYLWLCVWPHPLIFDYGTYVVKNIVTIALCALVLVLLAGGTVIALRRWPVVGFAGFWFFAILSPSSSVIPVVTQTVAEHRMYLSLAAVIVSATMGIHALLGQRSMVVFLVMAVGLGSLTTRRNEDYRSELSIWSDTTAKRPDSARAHYNLGSVLLQAGKLAEAIEQQREALGLKPDYAEARYNLGNALQQVGKPAEAIEQYEQALRLQPDDAPTHNNLGSALQQVGKLAEAKNHYEQALHLKPDYARAHNNLGLVLFQMGKVEGAKAQYEEALRLEPDYAKAHNNLGIALLQLGKVAEAKAQYEEALRLQPDYAEARNNLVKLQALQQTNASKN